MSICFLCFIVLELLVETYRFNFYISVITMVSVYQYNLACGDSLFLLQLSGGEKQRVALARAFLKAPAIL